MNESILVVDDDTELRKVLSSILSEEGYTVKTAENGKQAIKTSEKTRFDLALIDIKLPDMEGTKLLQRLKAKQPHIVMIIVTGFPTIENAMGAVNKGADGYILKPLEIGKLLQAVRKHLNKQAADHVSNWMEFEQDSTRKSRFDQDNAKKKSVYQPQ